MKNKFILSMGFILITLSFNIKSDNHKHNTDSFPGLVSTEVFELGNGMDMHVERRKTCNQGTVAKHFHPAAGTLVYVLDGKSQSKSSGKWKTYSNGDYWFERSDWVHGGETDAPDLGDVCSDILVIRVSESGKEHTVFIK
tara:strand:- start:209 stop:628 length:420 start_codon:yes stop_codon:yes gene_type:complete